MVILDPVLSSAPLRSGFEKQPEFSVDGDSAVVSWLDSTIGVHRYEYTVDTGTWNIRRFRKIFSGNPPYFTITYDAIFTWEATDSGVPLLTSLGLRGDTSLAWGGYRFVNIEINRGLDDSLFDAPVRRRPGTPGLAPRRGTLLVFPWEMPDKNDPASGWSIPLDLRGRVVPAGFFARSTPVTLRRQRTHNGP